VTRLRDALLLLALACTGCPGDAPRPDAPPDMRYGVDPCARCAMIVSEERFAAAYVTPEGEARRFDDLGCLTAHLVEQPEAVAEVWVHDDESRTWLRGSQAWYAHTEALMTPMGTGIVAVKDEAAARAVVARARGRVLGYDAFRALGPRAWPEKK
jgi:copper chaperone NosL